MCIAEGKPGSKGSHVHCRLWGKPGSGGSHGLNRLLDCCPSVDERLRWFFLAKLWLLGVFVNIMKHYRFLDKLLHLLLLQLLKNNHTYAFCSLRHGYNQLQSRSLLIYFNAIRRDLDILFQTAGNQSREL